MPAGCALAMATMVSKRMLFIIVTGLFPLPTLSPGPRREIEGLSRAVELEVSRSSRSGKCITLTRNFVKVLFPNENKIEQCHLASSQLAAVLSQISF